VATLRPLLLLRWLINLTNLTAAQAIKITIMMARAITITMAMGAIMGMAMVTGMGTEKDDHAETDRHDDGGGYD
jgi:hypothetical protein